MPNYIETYRGQAAAWECDDLGVWDTQFQLGRLNDAAWSLMQDIDLGPRRARRERLTLRPSTQDLRALRDIRAGDLVVVESVIVEVTAQSITARHRLRDGASGDIALTATWMGICTDIDRHEARDLPEDVQARARALLSEGVKA